MVSASSDLAVRLARESQSRLYGKYRGLVREVGAGDDLGYIRALVPEIYGESEVSPWAAPAAAFAGAKHGLVLLPEPDDGVWIEFEAGFISKPIWTGFYWARGEFPAGAAPKTRILATTAGHRLVLDDEADEVRLEHAGGGALVMTRSGVTLRFKNQRIVIDAGSINVNNGNLVVT